MATTTRPALPPIHRTAEPVDCKLEMRWVSEHRKEYVGEWIALDGDRLLAHGTDAKAVFAAARSQVPVPFVAHIYPDDDLPTVGGF
jgi:hypothetical protein